jgi:hypothetical protein
VPLKINGVLMHPTRKLDRDDMKEKRRAYVRTVFTFADWASHRSTRRYGRHLRGLLTSRIIYGLGTPIATVMAIATAVCAASTAYEVRRARGWAGGQPEGGRALRAEAALAGCTMQCSRSTRPAPPRATPLPRAVGLRAGGGCLGGAAA